MRYNKQELGLIKAVFSDNEELLFSVRKVFLQHPLTEKEEVTLRKALTPTVLEILRKEFFPQIDGDAPLFQLTDMHLGLEADLKLGTDEAWSYIRSKEQEIAYIKQQLKVLEGSDEEPKLVLRSFIEGLVDKDKEDAWVDVKSFNHLLSYIDTHISALKLLAGTKEETVEQTQARLKKDSSK